MSVIRVPDYNYGGFYYPEILLSLLEYNRVNVEELTSESEYESHIQALRAFALVGHLNNTRLDVVANELMLDSAVLPESVQKLFRLINVHFNSATPATSQLVIELSRIIDTDITDYIPQYTTFSTERGVEDEVEFEVQAAVDLDQTDGVCAVYAEAEFSSLVGVDGVVATGNPTRFTSAGASFPTTVVGKTLGVSNSANGNGGIYPITARIDANTIEVSGATFITETDLMWQVTEFSSDYSTKANTDSDEFTPWASYHAGNKIYVGHNQIQWDQLDLVIGATPALEFIGVWEYYDPTYSQTVPTTIVDNGGSIEVGVNSLLGTVKRQGGIVKVTYNPTGRSELLMSQWSTVNYLDTKGLLGQTIVDTNILNYTVQADWNPLPDQVDNSQDWQIDGTVTFTLPQTVALRWQKATLPNEVEAQFLRYRIVDSTGGTPTAPDIDRIKITEGTQYVPFNVLQGTSVLNETLGSSSGLAGQSFPLAQTPFLDDSQTIQVDETGGGTWETWIKMDDFRSSTATDRHYKLDVDKDGIATVVFSDGTNGRIPPIGTNNIRASVYRIGGDIDGNVGARTITGNDGGISYVADVHNPMDAVGWVEKDGATEANLEALKESGPASIRNQEKAVSSADIARTAVEEFTTADGSAIIARAFSVEEAYGPKTVELVCVGSGGGFLTVEELAEVEEWYNGDRYAIPPVEGRLLLNSELTAVNYDPLAVDVTVQVVGKGITVAEVEGAITAYLNPLTKDASDNYVHEFGGRLAAVKLDVAIDDLSDNITNVHRTVPSSDVLLGPRQLPSVGTLTVIVVETE